MMENSPDKRFYCSNDTKVACIDFRASFESLNERQKIYLYHLRKAASVSYLINPFRLSRESPLIFLVLYKTFEHDEIGDLRSKAIGAGLTDDEFDQFLTYAGTFFGESGNYICYGQDKIVPSIEKNQFIKLIKASNAFTKEERMAFWLENCVDQMYLLTEKEKNLQYPSIGTTALLSKDITEKDTESIAQFAIKHDLELFNTRAFKHPDGKLEIRYASLLPTDSNLYSKYLKVNDDNILLTRGDHSPFIKYLINHLVVALPYGTDLQQKYVENLITHFESGDIKFHKDATITWIDIVDSPIDFTFGFIETYCDPSNMRGLFDSILVVTDVEASSKYQKLVDAAPRLLDLLPWTKEFEAKTFQKPVFTQVNSVHKNDNRVRGQNLPNYSCIRNNKGFKNFCFGNTVSALYENYNLNFISSEDLDEFDAFRTRVFFMNLGVHELLGHGSGRLLCENKDGGLNFDESTLLSTGETVLASGKYYRHGQNFYNMFPKISGCLEECRAELVGRTLSFEKEILEIFGFSTEQEKKSAIKTILVSLIQMALKGLVYYNSETNCWSEAHAEGYYYKLRWLSKYCPGFVKFNLFTDEKDKMPNVTFTVDMNKANEARAALNSLLLKINEFKATADFDGYKKLSDELKIVSDDLEHPYLKFREISLQRSESKMMFQVSTTELIDGEYKYSFNEPSKENCVRSHLDNIPKIDNLAQIIEQEWAKDKHFFY